MRRIAVYLAGFLSCTGLMAQTPPAEVTGLSLDQSSTLTWVAAAGADDYNVYRGKLSWLASNIGAQCHGDEISGLFFASPLDPPPGEAYFYLVTAESNSGGEGSAGMDTGGAPRRVRAACDPLIRNHVLDRAGYGWSEYSSARLAAAGVQGYIDEQLDPASIDESTNTDWLTRRASLAPPGTLQELNALEIVDATYSRRQLEEQVTLFWDNHFNTDYRQTFMFFNFYQALFPATRAVESTKFHYDIQNVYRNLAFSGNFRQIVEAESLAPSMIIYLNTLTNVNTAPNENFARELLELHTMSVDGGYTQQDVVDLARVFTGWNACKKTTANAADPLSPCIPRNTYGTVGEPAGVWVNNFRSNLHDTGQKVLFAGTPYQAIIPSTASNPANGVNDVDLALDAIVAHPSTPRFIAKKLLQRLVTENPTQQMIDSVVAEWNDGTNPHGTGDLREVLRAVVGQAAFRNPDYVGGKIKTPFEHIVSALRAVRGKTDGNTLTRTYLTRMQEVFHQNPVPTGYSELGGDWLDTNNLLERQNFGLDLTSKTATNFGADVIGLLNSNGISTAPAPNNAAAIVDFLSGVFFAGELTPAERQIAMNYLNTDDNGLSANYNDARIRETAGFMLGFAQFLEQ